MHGHGAPRSVAADELRERVRERQAHALAVGALQPISHRCEEILAAGIPFQVRVAAHPRHEETRRARESKDRDPFLPYDEDLYVGDISDSHVVLLNKFNVIEHHLLVVTRAYAEQDDPLDLRDFEALVRCLAGIDGLAFYNGGHVAGASQRHKHLQIVPPLGPDDCRAPLETVLDPASRIVAPFRFLHGVLAVGFEPDALERTAGVLLDGYRALRERLGTGPYNLLLTRTWMLYVPRTREFCQGISINALGFCGSFFVWDEDALGRVKEHGALHMLEGVTRSV